MRYGSCGSVLIQLAWCYTSTYYISRQALQREREKNCTARRPLIRVLKRSSHSARLKERVPGADWWVRTAEPCLKSVNGGGRGAARSGGGAAEVSAGVLAGRPRPRPSFPDPQSFPISGRSLRPWRRGCSPGLLRAQVLVTGPRARLGDGGGRRIRPLSPWPEPLFAAPSGLVTELQGLIANPSFPGEAEPGARGR